VAEANQLIADIAEVIIAHRLSTSSQLRMTSIILRRPAVARFHAIAMRRSIREPIPRVKSAHSG